MIVADQVVKCFNGLRAVDNVSFRVETGETLILLGTSGCGKTTMLRMINHLTAPTSGCISVNGQPVSNRNAEKLRRGIGYVLQDHGLFPHYTVAQNLAIVPRLLNWNTNRIAERTRQLMDKLHLSANDYLHVYPDQLSGGQQQRVGLARALMADPPVLLMDEPFGALDPVTRASIRKEFNNLDELKRKTIVLVTHDVQEAFELGDRICLMDSGKIQQIGTPAALLFKPENDFVKTFLEEQRLQLELKSLKLIQLWDDLPAKTICSLSGGSLSAEESLWNVLSVFSKSNPTLTIKNEHSSEVKQIRFNDLLRAYHHYQNR
ncbi:MAG: ABC transporter ATP-binding protein [Sphingobacteriaceae bacterium]